MIHIITEDNRRGFHHQLTEMHRQRRKLFVDEMGWRLATHAGLEIDAYDSAQTIYLIEIEAGSGALVQSARLTPSTGSHLLGDVFPQLCTNGVPRAPEIWEASRFCPAPSTPKGAARQTLLMRMIAAILETGLLFGLQKVTYVASAALAPRAAKAGWDVTALGPAQRVGREKASAHIAEVSAAGLARVRALHGLALPLTRYSAGDLARAA